jgi:dsRNA-specific ribonuclease
VSARVEGRDVGSGSGRSKKHAEQEAARVALERYGSE